MNLRYKEQTQNITRAGIEYKQQNIISYNIGEKQKALVKLVQGGGVRAFEVPEFHTTFLFIYQ